MNHKGETFTTLQGRLTDTEKKVSESVSTLEKNQADTKAQVAQLNNSVETIIGGSTDWINLYVSADLGSDQIGDGSVRKTIRNNSDGCKSYSVSFYSWN